MTVTSILIGRYTAEGARLIATNGMVAARDSFAAAIAPPPAKGRILAWYAVDDHQWDIVTIVEVDNDDSAYWAKVQITRGRTGVFAETRLFRLVDAEAFDAAQLTA
jgi:hypothetical protein